MNSFSSDQIVCSLGEPFHAKQRDYLILRMIVYLLFEPFRDSSLNHLLFVCAIWHDCTFGGNGRLYTGFWVVLSLSTLYFWLAGKTKTKQVANRMSEWVDGGGSWKGHESGQAVIFLECLSFQYGRNLSAFLKCFLYVKKMKKVYICCNDYTYVYWLNFWRWWKFISW